ncbi:hypothetical protein EON81_27365 [bacterium]|nr:MAG: hypothetical protein EON81_27365 [bacterium]
MMPRHDDIRDDIMAEVRLLEGEGKQVRAVVLRPGGWKVEMLDGTRAGDTFPHLDRSEAETIRDLLSADLPELEIPDHEGEGASEEGWHVSLRRLS